MRLIGPIGHQSDITTTTRQLTMLGLSKPALLADTVNLWEDQIGTVTSLLRRKGLFARGLYQGLANDNYRVLGNRKVQWRLTGIPLQKGVIKVTVSTPNAGMGGTMFDLVLDTDFFSKNDVIELADQRTHLFIQSKEPTGTNSCTYRVSLVTNSSTAFVPSNLLEAGREVGFGHTRFPELSEDGGEKNTTDEWMTNYMAIQRMKYTISGSARNTKMAIEHNGQILWEYKANLDMMRRWHHAQEHSNLFGKPTVDADERIYLRDLQGRPIISGEGLFPQGDAGLKFSYNNLSFRVLDNILSQMDIMSGEDGVQEVMLVAGSEFTSAFERLMVDVIRANPVPLVETRKDGKVINTSFVGYKHNGVMLTVAKSRYFDNPMRPVMRDVFGRSITSQNAYFVSLGGVGNPNVELTTLGNGTEDRSFVQRIVPGMTGGVPFVGQSASGRIATSSSVDGMQVHILNESGIILKNPYGVAELIKSSGQAV